jgi:hypothetical protein
MDRSPQSTARELYRDINSEAAGYDNSAFSVTGAL